MSTSPEMFAMPAVLRTELDAVDQLSIVQSGSISEHEAARVRLAHGSPELHATVLQEALTDLHAATEVYCGDIESVLSTPEYEDVKLSNNVPRPRGELRQHEHSAQDFTGWLAVLKDYAPESVDEALAEVVDCVIDSYDREAFKRMTGLTRTRYRYAAYDLLRDAEDITKSVVDSIVRYCSSPDAARLFMDTALFADYGSKRLQLQLMQQIVSVTDAGEHNRTFEYVDMKRLASWYMGQLKSTYNPPPVDYALLNRISPGTIAAIAERNAARGNERALLLGSLSCEALLDVAFGEHTKAQANEIALLEQYIATPGAAAKLLERRMREGILPTEKELADLNQHAFQLDRLPQSIAKRVARLAMTLLPPKDMQRIYRRNAEFEFTPSDGDIAVRRLARAGDMRTAYLFAYTTHSPDIATTPYRLLSMYEESGDPDPLEEANAGVARFASEDATVGHSVYREYLVRLFLAARKQRVGALAAGAMVKIQSYYQHPSPEARYQTSRQMMQLHLDLDEPVAAETHALRLLKDPGLSWGQRIEPLQTLTVAHRNSGKYNEVTRLLQRHLPIKASIGPNNYVKWVQHLADGTYPTLPGDPTWNLHLDPSLPYKNFH